MNASPWRCGGSSSVSSWTCLSSPCVTHICKCQYCPPHILEAAEAVSDQELRMQLWQWWRDPVSWWPRHVRPATELFVSRCVSRSPWQWYSVSDDSHTPVTCHTALLSVFLLSVCWLSVEPWSQDWSQSHRPLSRLKMLKVSAPLPAHCCPIVEFPDRNAWRLITFSPLSRLTDRRDQNQSEASPDNRETVGRNVRNSLNLVLSPLLASSLMVMVMPFEIYLYRMMGQEWWEVRHG